MLFYPFSLKQKAKGKKVVGYGAAAKGNTLLNYAGVKPDLLPIICDAAPSKQGKFMPGSHIPIVSQEELAKANPDYVLILPWNISKEVRHENAKFLKEGVSKICKSNCSVPTACFMTRMLVTGARGFVGRHILRVI